MSLLVLVALFLASVEANIMQLRETITPGNVTVLRSSLRNTDGQLSSIQLNFNVTSENKNTTLEVFVVDSASLKHWFGDGLIRRVESSLVLTKCVAATGKLDNTGLQPVMQDTIDLGSEDKFVRRLDNLTEGIYYTLVSNCNKTGSAVSLIGTLEAKNPYGFLPGEAYMCLSFYKFLTGIYAMIVFVWTAEICMHRDSAIGLQKWAITVVLISALLEYMFTFALCEYMNDLGAQHPYLVLCAAIIKAFKDTFTRALMLAISKGVGVMRDSMEPATMGALGILSAGYLVSHLIYEAEMYQNMKLHQSHPGQLLSSLFLSISSTILFYWIYVSLLATRKELKLSKQTFKLNKMKRVSSALTVTGIWAISWIFFQRYPPLSYFIITKSQDDYWRFFWLFESMWQLIFLFVVCSLAWLWRPDEQWSARANSEQLNQDDELEMEKQEVEMVTQRTAGYMLGTEAQD